MYVHQKTQLMHSKRSAFELGGKGKAKIYKSVNYIFLPFFRCEKA